MDEGCEMLRRGLPVAIIRGKPVSTAERRVQRRGTAEQVGFWCQKQYETLIGPQWRAGIDRHTPPQNSEQRMTINHQNPSSPSRPVRHSQSPTDQIAKTNGCQISNIRLFPSETSPFLWAPSVEAGLSPLISLAGTLGGALCRLPSPCLLPFRPPLKLYPSVSHRLQKKNQSLIRLHAAQFLQLNVETRRKILAISPFKHLESWFLTDELALCHVLYSTCVRRAQHRTAQQSTARYKSCLSSTLQEFTSFVSLQSPNVSPG